MNLHISEIFVNTAALAGSALFCYLIILCAMPFAREVKLVDKPSSRKTHRGKIPLIGGLSIFLTFLLCQLAFSQLQFNVLLTVSCGLLVVLGVADDFLDLGAKLRLVVQALVATLMVIGGGYEIASVGALFSEEPIVLGGAVATAFSIFCIIGVINTINMIDGADGLAGGVVAISVIGLMIASMGNPEHTHIDNNLLYILGAISAFLTFNLGLLGRRKKIFMGDSGSMFLGAFLAAYFIYSSQGPTASISPVVAGWLFGLPLLDGIAVMVSRVMLGKSPLNAGRDHLHHRILDCEISQKACVSIMLSLHAVMVCIGLLGNYYNLSMPIMFWAFVSLVVAHFIATPMILKHVESLRFRAGEYAPRR